MAMLGMVRAAGVEGESWGYQLEVVGSHCSRSSFSIEKGGLLFL